MNPSRPVISLLHATRGRPDLALEARDRWLKAAAHPERVEHIFAVDCDDRPAQQAVASLRHRIVPEKGGGCVAAWNLAAEASSGDVLVQLSDDWIPADGWDEEFVRRLRDVSQPAVLRPSDGHRRDDLLCMAILTRARLRQQGEFLHPGYFGVFSDDEFSFRAYLDGVVIDARDLVLTHRHPHYDASVVHDETYIHQNNSERSRKGHELFMERNPEAQGHWLHEGTWERFFVPLAGTISIPILEAKPVAESAPVSAPSGQKALRKAENLFLKKKDHVDLFRATAMQAKALLESVRKSPFGKMALKSERLAPFMKCLEGARHRRRKRLMLEACASYLQATRLGLELLGEIGGKRLVKSKALSASISGLRLQYRSQRKWLSKLKRWIDQLPPTAEAWGVDREFYIEQAGQWFSTSALAARHYDKQGWQKGLNPHPLFNTRHFQAQNAGRIDPQANPLEEYHRLVDEGDCPEANPRFPGTWLREFFLHTFEREPKVLAEIPEAPVNLKAAQDSAALKPSVLAGTILNDIDEEARRRFLLAFDEASNRMVETGYSPVPLRLVDETGFARIHNGQMRAAFSSAETTHYLCLDASGRLHPDALVELVKTAENTAWPALVEARLFPFEDPKEYDGTTGETHWCQSRCLLIPRFVFELTGGFDEALPTHAAAIDLCWRVWQSGCRCLIAPSALIHTPATDASHGTSGEKLLLESGRVLAQKWQCPKFRAHCERALIERGHFRSIAELPALPSTTPQAPHRRVDFEHELAFAPTRW